jgi:hypothetical protein
LFEAAAGPNDENDRRNRGKAISNDFERLSRRPSPAKAERDD